MSGPESVKVDPFELWRKLYEMGEQSLKAAGAGASACTSPSPGTPGTKSASDASAKVIETLIAIQKASQEAAARAPESLNLPTRDDLARLSDIVTSIGEKIERLDARLAAIERAAPSYAAATPRAVSPKSAPPKSPRPKAAGPAKPRPAPRKPKARS